MHTPPPSPFLSYSFSTPTRPLSFSVVLHPLPKKKRMVKCWTDPVLFAQEQARIVRDHVKGNCVHVNIPPEVLRQADNRPMLKTALLRLFKTNIVCTSQASCTYPSEEIPWALIGTFLRPVFPSCIGKNYFPSASWTG